MQWLSDHYNVWHIKAVFCDALKELAKKYFVSCLENVQITIDIWISFHRLEVMCQTQITFLWETLWTEDFTV